MAALPPDDVHEWLSFEDPEDDRTWLFDLTFLQSAWTCIYGRGCFGVLTGPAAELERGCCSYGAHITDDEDLAGVERAAARLDDTQWQHRRRARRSGWWVAEVDGTRITRVVDGACIFLNRPGFARGAGCALHVGALDAGERPLDWKPDVCWQLPLRRVDTVDEHGHVTSTVREWKRRDWGEGGFEFHWWCTDAPDAFVGSRSVYAALRDELVALVGPAVYELLGGELRRRSRRVAVAHPALRR